MTKQQKAELRKRYNRLKRAAKEQLEACSKFHELNSEFFGFEPNRTDDSEIIDTIDYGTSSLSFNSYLEKMDKYKLCFEQEMPWNTINKSKQ